MFVFFVVEREENRQKQMTTGISGFGFFWSKNGRFVTHMFSSKKVCWTLIFIVFWAARFLGHIVKKEILDTPHHQKRENLTDNWKAHFCIFWFFWFFSLSSFLFVFCCFFGVLKGQVRWPEGQPHLALNRFYLFYLFFLGFVFLFCFFFCLSFLCF